MSGSSAVRYVSGVVVMSVLPLAVPSLLQKFARPGALHLQSAGPADELVGGITRELGARGVDALLASGAAPAARPFGPAQFASPALGQRALRGVRIDAQVGRQLPAAGHLAARRPLPGDDASRELLDELHPDRG